MPSKLYCKGAMPPAPVAVILPFTLPQADDVVVAVSVGAAELPTVTVAVFVQPIASLTVTVYTPGVSPVKKLLA